MDSEPCRNQLAFCTANLQNVKEPAWGTSPAKVDHFLLSESFIQHARLTGELVKLSYKEVMRSPFLSGKYY